MPPATRLLTASMVRLLTPPAPPPSGPHPVDTDMAVILASLLCAMVSVAGLALIARCGCPRRSHGGGGGGGEPQAPPDKGLKKKALRQIPKVSYHRRGGDEVDGDRGAAAAAECPICLSEFEEGDQLRLLPQCGHGFHAGCVDAWLRSHSSCPSCRRVLVVLPPPSRCRGRCGADCTDAAEPAAAVGGGER